jgi:signal transduction histidine kinase
VHLRLRVAITSLIVAVPAALVLFVAINSIRSRDQSIALERFVTSQLNEQVRERCESDPTWFLTGPLDGRPKPGEPPNPNPDALPPRPKVVERPFELFAFDEDFMGSSPATPRFPNDLRFALRQSSAPVIAPFETKDGTGVQMAVWTGWITGPCAVFLGRLRPEPNGTLQKLALFGGLFVVCYGIAIAAVGPTVRRVRRLAGDAREAAREGHASIAPDRSRDELSSVAFVYNEVAKELHLRTAEGKDREEALRRFFTDAMVEVARPLDAVAARVGVLEMSGHVPAAARDDLRRAVRETHDLAARLNNLALAAELRARRAPANVETIDLDTLVTRVVSRHEAFARTADVTVRAEVPGSPVLVEVEQALVDQAIGNLVDNAIRHNRPGGHVTVVLRSPGDGRLSLKVIDDGPGIGEEEFKGLTAIRRFRGDEGRDRRPGVPGLGLAVAREVIERLGWRLDLARPSGGGFEVEVTGNVQRATSQAPSAAPR